MTCRGERTFFYDAHLLAFAVSGAVHVGYNQCLDAASTKNGTEVIVYGCHSPTGVTSPPGSTQRFRFTEEGEMRHTETGRCLTFSAPYEVTLEACRGETTQKWKFYEVMWRRK